MLAPFPTRISLKNPHCKPIFTDGETDLRPTVFGTVLSVTVNTNIASLQAQVAVMTNQRRLDASMTQLSTGRRINGAADDAAGLAVSTRMSSGVTQLHVGIKNANDAVGMIQTADSAMSAATDMLQRMRSLALQAATGTATGADRAYLSQEFRALATEISRIGMTTTFNGQQLLDGSVEESISFLTSSLTDPLEISFKQLATTAVPYGTTWNGDAHGPLASGSPALLTQYGNGSTFVTTIAFLGDGNDFKVGDIISFRADSAVWSLKITEVEEDSIQGYSSAITKVSTLSDDDISQKFGSSGTPFTDENVLEGASFVMDGFDITGMRIGGKDGATWRNHLIILKEGTNPTLDFQIVESATYGASMGYSTTSRGLTAASYHADISNAQSAYNALDAITHDLAAISEERAKYGATINNILHAINSMQIGATTATASKSRILDTDYAKATAELARNQIILQAGKAVIAQANALPEVVLSLLRT